VVSLDSLLFFAINQVVTRSDITMIFLLFRFILLPLSVSRFLHVTNLKPFCPDANGLILCSTSKTSRIVRNMWRRAGALCMGGIRRIAMQFMLILVC
jgi:hypothetical protein